MYGLLFLTFFGGLFLIGLCLYLMAIFHILYVWLYVVVILGGLLLTGFFVDLVAKKKKIQTDIKEGSKNASESQRTFTENGMNAFKNDINDGGSNNFYKE